MSDEEYTLEQTALFNEFKALFEGMMERHVQVEMGTDLAAVYEAVERDLKSTTSFHSGHTLVLVINACTEFGAFHEMMTDAKEGCFCWGMPPLEDTETGEIGIE